MILYRYELTGDCDIGIRLKMHEYEVIRETEYSYLIKQKIGNFYVNNEKWIRKNPKKGYARRTKKEALNDFIFRYEKYIKILKYKLNKAEIGFELAKKQQRGNK